MRASPFTLLAGVLAILVLALVPPAAGADPIVPARFADSPVISGLTHPTVVRFAADGRVFVAEKSGLIKVYDSLEDGTPTTFADLRTQVDDYWDRGLLGLVLDPGFPTTPYVYALYSLDAPIGGTAPVWNDGCPTPPGPTGDGCVIGARLVRMTASGNTMSGSPQTLIEGWCQQYPSHSVGQLQFGPDGALYASSGDGASFTFADYGQQGNPKNPCGDPPAGVGGVQTPPTAEGGALRSQSLLRPPGQPAVLNGTVIRVDPATGAGLPSNPRGGDLDPAARRIVASGMRNPFRFTFRPGTSELWIGDVGWNNWEEINRAAAPLAAITDFGWPCYEGVGPQAGYQAAGLAICNTLYSNPGSASAPYWTYQHGQPAFAGDTCSTNTGSSISGLAFYPGGPYPARYDGALFVADYTRNCVWAMLPGANGLPDPSRTENLVTNARGPVELEIGPGGDLFYPAFDNGTIDRLAFAPTGAPPHPVATATPTAGPAPLTVHFDGSHSSDPDGDPLTYAWDLDGDGAFDDSTLAQPTFTYATTGPRTVRLRVDDGQVSVVSDPLTISVGAAPVPHIDAPSPSLTWKVGDTIAFSGGAADAIDGTVAPSGLSWNLRLHHCTVDLLSCHVHDLETIAGVPSGTITAPDHDYPSYLELRLTATDSLGLASTAIVTLDPRPVELSFASHPAGLRLAVGSAAGPAPFTRTVIAGSTNSVAALTPQPLGGKSYSFSSWSDGGARAHDLVAPDHDATYTATFAGPAVPGPEPSHPPSPPLARLANPSSLSAYRGRLAWSAYDPATHRFRLMSSNGVGPPAALRIPARAVPFDVDLGPGPDGKTVAVYSRCAREPTRATAAYLPDWTSARGCDLYRYDFATRREHRLTGPSTRRASEFLPSAWRGRVAFARLRARRGAKPVLFVRGLGPGARSVRVRGGSRGTVAMPTALDLHGGRLAFAWLRRTGRGGPDTEIWLARVGGQAHRLDRRVNPAPPRASVRVLDAPAFAGEDLYWGEECYGAVSACAGHHRQWRLDPGTGLRASAPLSGGPIALARTGETTYALAPRSTRSAFGARLAYAAGRGPCRSEPPRAGDACALAGWRPAFAAP